MSEDQLIGEIKRLLDLIRDHEFRIDRLERYFDKIQGRFKISKQTDLDDIAR